MHQETLYDIFIRPWVVVIRLLTAIKLLSRYVPVISHDQFVGFQPFFFSPSCLFISLFVCLTPFHPCIRSVPVTVYSCQSRTNTKPPSSQRPLAHCGFVWAADQLALCGTAFLTRLFIRWMSSHQGGKGRREGGQSRIGKKLLHF